jgi:CBS domain-containing protein
MNMFHKLNSVSLTDIALIESPERDINLDLNSPALEVFNDFTERTPLMLEQTTTVDEAIETMRRTHVKLYLVIDGRESLRGVITLADLLSVKVMRVAEATGLRRSDLAVSHVMVKRQDLHAIDLQALGSARIGDVLATMKSFGDQHVLVIDPDRKSVRGIISAVDIARGLHAPVRITDRANSFADVYRAIQV